MSIYLESSEINTPRKIFYMLKLLSKIEVASQKVRCKKVKSRKIEKTLIKIFSKSIICTENKLESRISHDANNIQFGILDSGNKLMSKGH